MNFERESNLHTWLTYFMLCLWYVCPGSWQIYIFTLEKPGRLSTELFHSWPWSSLRTSSLESFTEWMVAGMAFLYASLPLSSWPSVCERTCQKLDTNLMVFSYSALPLSSLRTWSMTFLIAVLVIILYLCTQILSWDQLPHTRMWALGQGTHQELLYPCLYAVIRCCQVAGLPLHCNNWDNSLKYWTIVMSWVVLINFSSCLPNNFSQI